MELKQARRLFLGSPVTLSAPALLADVTNYQGSCIILEILNPTVKPVVTKVICAPEFVLVAVQSAAVTVPAGASVTVTVLQSNQVHGGSESVADTHPDSVPPDNPPGFLCVALHRCNPLH